MLNIFLKIFDTNIWIEIFILPLIPIVIWEIGKAIYRKIKLYYARKKQNEFAGEWYCFFYTDHGGKGELKFVTAKLTATKTISLKYEIKEERETDETIRYEGEMEIEGTDFILIKMNNDSHTEFVLFRIYKRLASKESRHYGLQLSLSDGRHPYSGAIAMSRTKMNEAEFLEFVKSKYHFINTKKMLTSYDEK